MAFRTPVFNIQVGVWRAASGGAGVPASTPMAQLRAAGRQSTGQDPNHDWVFLWSVALPMGTDVRDWASGSEDWVEAPLGSGRKYRVQMVDDVAKGFANEYRIAFLQKVAGWPAPIP